MNSQSAFNALVKLKNIFNKINQPYFIMGGTLLGFIREGNIISHDEDVDIGIFTEELNPNLVNILQQNGVIFNAIMGDSGNSKNSVEYRFFIDDIQIDIFCWHKEAEYCWYSAWWKSGESFKLKFDTFSISSKIINEETFSIPDSPEHWLEQIYGNDWKTPNKQWHWAASPKNVIDAPFDNLTEKKICLGMIVKNESKIIKECLEAVKPIIDSWVIIDTGSTDNTKEIIKETLSDIRGGLLEKEWKNFGYNRTEVFEYIKNNMKCDYMLMIDSDEIINITSKINKKLLIADYYDINFNDGYSYYYPSLLSTKYNWKSIGVTHEYWSCNEPNLVKEYLPNISILHKCTGSRRNNKSTEDLNLLLNAEKKEPNNSRYIFYIAQTYREIGQYDNAINYYNKRIALGGWWEEVYYSHYMLIKCFLAKKDLKSMLNEMEIAQKILPDGIEPIYEIIRYCRINKLYLLGYCLGKSIKNVSIPKTQRLFVSSYIYNYAFYDELSICAYYVEKYNEAIEFCDLALLGNPPIIDYKRIVNNKDFSIKKIQ